MGNIAKYIAQRRSSSSDIYIYEIDILNADETLKQKIDIDDILGGTINITKQNGSRRNATITFENSSGKYTPDPNGLFWLENKILIKTGIIADGKDELFDQGIFVLRAVDEVSTQSLNTIDYELLDKFSYLDGTLSGTLKRNIVIPTGTANLVDAIDYLFELANSEQPLVNYTNKPLVANPIVYTIPFTATENAGGTYFSFMSKLIEAQGLELYFDRSGYPRLEIEVDLINDPPIYTFEEYDKVKKSTRRRTEFDAIKNDGRVEGQNWSDGTIGDAEGSITLLTNPMNITRIGRRQFYINAPSVVNDADAKLLLDYTIDNNQRVPENIDVNFISLDFLDVGNIVNLNEKGLNVSNQRYVVRQLAIPIIQSTDMTASFERTITY